MSCAYKTIIKQVHKTEQEMSELAKYQKLNMTENICW